MGSRGSGPPSGPRGPSRPRPPSEGVTCAHRQLRAFGRSLRLRPPGRESSSLLAPTAGQDPPFPWSAHPITAGGCGRDGGGEGRGGQCQGLPEGPQDPHRVDGDRGAGSAGGCPKARRTPQGGRTRLMRVAHLSICPVTSAGPEAPVPSRGSESDGASGRGCCLSLARRPGPQVAPGMEPGPRGQFDQCGVLAPRPRWAA